MDEKTALPVRKGEEDINLTSPRAKGQEDTLSARTCHQVDENETYCFASSSPHPVLNTNLKS